MAIFKKQFVQGHCGLCGRLRDVVLVLFSSKPLVTRQRITSRLKVCGRCGQLIHLLATTEKQSDVNRNRTSERERPRKHKPKVK